MANRPIPFSVNADHANPVAWLLISDKLSDEEILECDVAWEFQIKDGKRILRGGSLVPKPKMPGPVTAMHLDPEPGGQGSRVGDTDYG